MRPDEEPEPVILRSDPLMMDELTPPASWFLWLLPVFLVGLCIVLVVTA